MKQCGSDNQISPSSLPSNSARDGPPQAPPSERAHAAVQQVLLKDLQIFEYRLQLATSLQFGCHVLAVRAENQFRLQATRAYSTRIDRSPTYTLFGAADCTRILEADREHA